MFIYVVSACKEKEISFVSRSASGIVERSDMCNLRMSAGGSREYASYMTSRTSSG